MHIQDETQLSLETYMHQFNYYLKLVFSYITQYMRLSVYTIKYYTK